MEFCQKWTEELTNPTIASESENGPDDRLSCYLYQKREKRYRSLTVDGVGPTEVSVAEQRRFFDVWFVTTNMVYKEVPYHVVTDWVQQVRLQADDMIKPAGSPNWFRLGGLPMFQPYLPQASPAKTSDDLATALAPIEMDFAWKRRYEDEDDDVDMIPLIDISLVLLIFFMMTTTVAAISRVRVPTMANAVDIDKDPRILRIDMDRGSSGTPVYAIAKAKEAPEDVNNNLPSLERLQERLQAILGQVVEAPEVRIAAHLDLPYEEVEKVMALLDSLQNKGQLRLYRVEVTEKIGQ